MRSLGCPPVSRVSIHPQTVDSTWSCILPREVTNLGCARVNKLHLVNVIIVMSERWVPQVLISRFSNRKKGFYVRINSTFGKNGRKRRLMLKYSSYYSLDGSFCLVKEDQKIFTCSLRLT